MPKQRPARLNTEQFRELAYNIAQAAFAGKDPAYRQARADGIERGLLVLQVHEIKELGGDDVALHVTSGFQPMADVPALLGPVLNNLDEVMELLRRYRPEHEVVVTVLAPNQARSFRISKNTPAVAT